jgi:hypothetical protein
VSELKPEPCVIPNAKNNASAQQQTKQQKQVVLEAYFFLHNNILVSFSFKNTEKGPRLACTAACAAMYTIAKGTDAPPPSSALPAARV